MEKNSLNFSGRITETRGIDIWRGDDGEICLHFRGIILWFTPEAFDDFAGRVDAFRQAEAMPDDRCTACGGHLDTEGHVPGCGNESAEDIAARGLGSMPIFGAEEMQFSEASNPTEWT